LVSNKNKIITNRDYNAIQNIIYPIKQITINDTKLILSLFKFQVTPEYKYVSM